MYLKDCNFQSCNGNIYEFCEKNNLYFEVIKDMSKVLLFDNKKSVIAFLSKPENKTEKRLDKFMNYNFIVKNYWLGNDVVIHSRRLIDYDMKSDNTEIVILKYKQCLH